MKKGTTKIAVHTCITCTSGFHKKNQFPRPTCAKIYFEGDEDRWVQICADCWNELDAAVRKEFDNDTRMWAKYFEKEIKAWDKKVKK